jgi:hypothetical protein
MLIKAKLVSFNNPAASMRPMLDDVFDHSNLLLRTSKTIQKELNQDSWLVRMKIMLWLMSMRLYPVIALWYLRPQA